MSDPPSSDPPRDSASVVLLRDAGDGPEVFLLRRSGDSTVLGNVHVFAGGKVDPEDHDGWPDAPEGLGEWLGEPELDPRRARALVVAACRETREETGVVLTPAELVPLSRWITPERPALMKRRFDTRFFLARLPAGATASHDGQEADQSVWLTPKRALAAYYDDAIHLAPPQIMTLMTLASEPSVEAMLGRYRGKKPPLVEPMPFEVNGRRAVAYPGDPLHPVRERAMPGPTRLTLVNGRFR